MIIYIYTWDMYIFFIITCKRDLHRNILPCNMSITVEIYCTCDIFCLHRAIYIFIYVCDILEMSVRFILWEINIIYKFAL